MSDKVQVGRGRNVAKIDYNGLRYEIDIDSELSINREDLPTGYADQPGKYAWYATVYVAAQLRVERMRMRLEVVQSTVAAKLRSKLDDKGKPPSEASIKSQLPSNPEVMAAQEDHLRAIEEEGVVRAVKEAFVHRRDMLIQMGADVRAEQRDLRT
jgi:hypothetical protein